MSPKKSPKILAGDSSGKRSHNIAVFCSGRGSNFEALILAQKAGKLGGTICLLVCDKADAYALVRAKKYNIPSVLLPSNLFPTRESWEQAIITILQKQEIDLIVLAGFMRILTPYFIRAFANRILNVHPSLLPAFKGAHAIRDAFQAKAKETGVTIHWVTEELDSGPILAQKKINISPKDSLSSLEEKIHQVEHKLYPETIRRVLTKGR